MTQEEDFFAFEQACDDIYLNTEKVNKRKSQKGDERMKSWQRGENIGPVDRLKSDNPPQITTECRFSEEK